MALLRLIPILLATLLIRTGEVHSQPYTEFALTASSASYAADLPSWSPNGESIIYTRYWFSSYYRNHLYAVQGNASTVSEIQLATVPSGSGDFPSSLSWVGSQPIMSEKLGLNAEYLTFQIPSIPPVSRTIFNGSDANFTVKLKGDYASVTGFGLSPEQGDLVRVSRDGSTVLIRWKSSTNGTTYQATTKIFTAPYTSMAGQFISKDGTTTDWEDQPGVVLHLTKTEQYLQNPYSLGAGLTPDGSKFLISDGVSIWLRNSDGSSPPASPLVAGIPYKNPETLAIYYLYPDVSPDGSKFLYVKNANQGDSGLYLRNIDGTGEVPVVIGQGMRITWPTFAPDGKRAAYVRNSQIYRVSGLKGFNDCNNNDIADVCDIPSDSQPAICTYHCIDPALCQLSNDCDGNGVPDDCQTDTDKDGVIDSCDACPSDPNKWNSPGVCGCNQLDVDDDKDGAMNCLDSCPNDPLKSISAGICGCGVPDTDTDGDGSPNCVDLCPTDRFKKAAGACGCGVADTDSDGDSTADCIDGCPADRFKTSPGVCGCGVADVDLNKNGKIDCAEIKILSTKLSRPKVKQAGKKVVVTLQKKSGATYLLRYTILKKVGKKWKAGKSKTVSSAKNVFTLKTLKRGQVVDFYAKYALKGVSKQQTPLSKAYRYKVK